MRAVGIASIIRSSIGLTASAHPRPLTFSRGRRVQRLLDGLNVCFSAVLLKCRSVRVKNHLRREPELATVELPIH